MPRLVLSLDGVVLREVGLAKDRTTIGRRSHNDIVIDNLAVSGEHSVIYTSSATSTSKIWARPMARPSMGSRSRSTCCRAETRSRSANTG